VIVERVFQEDLPIVRIPQLRASGLITVETSAFSICLDGVEKTVGVVLRRLANGGSWSLFTAPCCGRRARALWLLEGSVVCRRCCIARGVRYRCEPAGLRRRAELRVPKLRALLQSEVRLKPARWGKVERRFQLEAALRRAELLVGYTDFVKPEPGED
jgi:hypothetical protein